LFDRKIFRAGFRAKGPSAKLPKSQLHFAFIDAEKTEYDSYYELILPRLRQNGLVLFDNMLWGGRLGSGPVQDPAGRAIDELNHKLAEDRRLEASSSPERRFRGPFNP
jgi:caffeoyl-CoA O-methyltransferase